MPHEYLAEKTKVLTLLQEGGDGDTGRLCNSVHLFTKKDEIDGN